MILKLCPKMLNKDGVVVDLVERERQVILHDIAIDSMAKNHAKPIAFAYRDIPFDQYIKMQAVKKVSTLDDEQKADLFENNLIFLALMGIRDSPRKEVAEHIQECKDGGVTLRMITSDNMFSARATAIELGLITKEESLEEYVCMEAKDFIKYVGNLQKIVDEFGDVVSEEVPKKIAFQTVTSKLKVLARCTPTIKYALVCGLMDESIVAVTGKSNEDYDIMNKADVGICLSSRLENDSIKDAADIIMVSDSLEKIVMSMKWGRALYANARKYLQFSITINISLIIIMVLGNFKGDPQLQPVHILWLNVVMDNIMALAFATDSPTEAVIKIQKPLKRDENVMTAFIAKNITIYSMYISAMLCFFIFLGPWVLNLPFERHTMAFDPVTKEASNKTIHTTMVFNLVIWCTVVVALVSRRIHDEEKNIFKDIFTNKLFNTFIIGMVLVHIAMVQFGGMNFDVTSLKLKYHLICIGMASSIFLVAYLAKFIPNVRFQQFQFTEEVEELDINQEEY